ncbi:MAG: ECF transporter S component [Oscillospiraceae bacterium]|nr:ECF transporter S component [Oscillospiraceae bacterium]
MKTKKAFDTRKLVLLSLLTAIVVILQFLGSFIKFGTFSIQLVSIPITVGAALIGVYAGGWLGIVFGLVVLLSGDAAAFLAINPAATVAVVLLKGMLAGIAGGVAYNLLARKNRTVAAIVAATVYPIVNSVVFIIGSYMFFLPTLTQWGIAAGATNVTEFIFLTIVGMNFVIEFVLSLLLSPTVVRLIQYGQDRRNLSGSANKT